MKSKIETKRTLITDNGNRFIEGSEIAFTYKNSGDKYIAEIVQIKKKSFIIRDIEINKHQLPSQQLMKIPYKDIEPGSCSYVAID